jgi:hypothetical protein
MKKEPARDSMGFLINPKNFTYNGYRILAVEFEHKTVYDVYLGHVFRDTFNTVEAAKQYIDQPRF